MAVVITREPKLSMAAAGTAGNLAYDLSYGEGTAQAQFPAAHPRHAENPARERAQEQVRERARERVHSGLRVRQQQAIAPLSICGFLTVAVCLVVLLMSYIQLLELSDSIVGMRNEIKSLQAEEAALLIQYENAYDLKEITSTLSESGTMAPPRSDQVIYLDLAEADNAVVYKDAGEAEEYVDVFRRLGGAFSDALEYFK